MTIKQSDAIERQIVVLTEALIEAREREDTLEAKYGTDQEDGTVIRFKIRFLKGGTKYSYAAIRANGLWFTTGPRSPKGYTWAELTAWFEDAHKVYGLKVVS